jgi:hypothetical protein
MDREPPMATIVLVHAAGREADDFGGSSALNPTNLSFILHWERNSSFRVGIAGGQGSPVPLFDLRLESVPQAGIRLKRLFVMYQVMARQPSGWARPLAADRALVHRAGRRLGHPALIPRAFMSRSPEALASGPAVISFRRRYHCPSAGAFLTGLATAVGPASRRGFRVGAMLTLLRLPP